MLIRLKLTEDRQNLLYHMGVPRNILRKTKSFKLTDHLSPINFGGKERMKVNSQAEKFKNLYEATPIITSYLYIIGTNFDIEKAQLVAAVLLNKYDINYKNEMDIYSFPTWIHLRSGTFNDVERIYQSNKRPRLVILDGLSMDSSGQKIEKARDLISHFNMVPKVLICSGCNPLEFALNKLKLMPASMLYVNKLRNYQI